MKSGNSFEQFAGAGRVILALPVRHLSEGIRRLLADAPEQLRIVVRGERKQNPHRFVSIRPDAGRQHHDKGAGRQVDTPGFQQASQRAGGTVSGGIVAVQRAGGERGDLLTRPVCVTQKRGGDGPMMYLS